MPLQKMPLAQGLRALFEGRPTSAAEAGARAAQSYLGFAATAISSAGTLPVTAPALLPVLVAGFSGGFAATSPSAAAARIAQAVSVFWQGLVWVGPGFTGATAAPGNFSLASALGAILSDLGERSASDQASRMADAFETGARQVIVSDLSTTSPPVPVVGPVS